MVINPSVPAKTVPEFIVYAKANPGKINMASSGNGSVSHVFGELFKMMAGADLVHVPYRGGYVPDLLGGQTQVVFGTIASCIQLISAGKLRALPVTTAMRSTALPHVPGDLQRNRGTKGRLIRLRPTKEINPPVVQRRTWEAPVFWPIRGLSLGRQWRM